MSDDKNKKTKLEQRSNLFQRLTIRLIWLKSQPVLLLKWLFIFVLIQYLYNWCNYLSFGSNGVIFFLMLILFLPIERAAVLLEVVILYWLIDYWISKLKIHYFIKVIIITGLLISAYSVLSVFIVTLRWLPNYSVLALFKMIRLRFAYNYSELLGIFNPMRFSINRLLSYLSQVHNVTLVLTVFLPSMVEVFRLIKVKNEMYAERMHKQANDLLFYQAERQKRYIKKHGMLKPPMTLDRCTKMLILGMGYLVIYVGALSCFMFIPSVVQLMEAYWEISNWIASLFILLLGIGLIILGLWVINKYQKLIDIHYIFSSYKINWFINVLIMLLLVILTVVVLFNQTVFGSAFEKSIGFSCLGFAIISLLNSIRLRKKFKQSINESQFTNEITSQ